MQPTDDAGPATVVPPGPVLAPTGELDLVTTPALASTLSQLTDAGCPEVVIDLSGVTFIDCTALGSLIAARNRLSACGGDLVLRDPSPFATMVLARTHLTELVAAGE